MPVQYVLTSVIMDFDDSERIKTSVLCSQIAGWGDYQINGDNNQTYRAVLKQFEDRIALLTLKPTIREEQERHERQGVIRAKRVDYDFDKHSADLHAGCKMMRQARLHFHDEKNDRHYIEILQISRLEMV